MHNFHHLFNLYECSPWIKLRITFAGKDFSLRDQVFDICVTIKLLFSDFFQPKRTKCMQAFRIFAPQYSSNLFEPLSIEWEIPVDFGTK